MKKSARGFTLIELMVVVAIIAILVTIGLVVFTGAEKNGRDGKRRADIQAISTALESHYINAATTCPGQSSASTPYTYCPIQNTWFNSNNNTVPNDPLGGSYSYCIVSNTTAAAIADPAASWGNAGCSSVSPGTWVSVTEANTQPAINSNSWKVCASLENAPGLFCIGNQQQ